MESSKPYRGLIHVQESASEIQGLYSNYTAFVREFLIEANDCVDLEQCRNLNRARVVLGCFCDTACELSNLANTEVGAAHPYHVDGEDIACLGRMVSRLVKLHLLESRH